MAAKKFAELCIEEFPRYEGAPTTTPYRLATETLDLPSRAVKLSANPAFLSRKDELRGVLGEVPDLIDGYAPAGTLSIRAYPKELTWLLALAGFDYTHTTGDGVITDPDGATIPTGAHRWVFSKRDGITPRTARIRTNYDKENVLLTGHGFALSQLGLPASGEMSGSLLGLVVARAAADTTTTPSLATQAIWPFRRGDLYLSWLSGGGAVADFDLSIANSLSAISSLSLSTPSFFPDLMEFGDDQVLVTGNIPKRVLSGTDYDALLAATTFAATARWKSAVSIGATSYKYALWAQMPACMYSSGDADDLGNKRRHGATFGFKAEYDESAGYDCRFTLVNATSSIETFA